jgi:predicted transcriptional regulator
MEHPNADLLTLAANIVSAHVEHNEVSHSEVPRLIREVYETLVDVGRDHSRPAVRHAAAVTPAVRRAKAGGSDEILTCLECGMKMKMLKRHLLTVHGMTPEDYRRKHNLPGDTPMVTSNYAELRSQLAKANGLGKRQSGRGRG